MPSSSSPKPPRLHKRTAATKGFTPKQIAALSAANEGNKSRTPKVVVDALFPTPIMAGDLVLRPLSLAEFILLEKLDSPLLELESVDEEEITIEQFAVAVYLLTTPYDEVDALVCDRPRAEFDRAVRQFSRKLPPAELITIGLKVRTAIAAAFATVQQVSGGEKKTAQTPASAGG